MKKWMLSLLLCLVLVLCVLPATANADTYGDWVYKGYEEDVMITAYNGDDLNIVIPSQINGRDVAAIGNNVFENCYDLVSVVLPETLESIGWSTFRNCTSLQEIILPEKLTNVGPWAFQNCKQLNKIIVKSKDLGGFSDDTFLDAGKEAENGIEVIFEDTATQIPKHMFNGGNSYVGKVVLGEAIEWIGDSAFHNCYNLVSVDIPENSALTSIGWSTFQNCTSLQEIVFPEKLTNVGPGAFQNCKQLNKIIVKSKNLGDFSEDTFLDAGKEAENGIEVIFEDTVTQIPKKMFYGKNSHIGKVALGEAIEWIGYNAFCGCNNLASIEIPDNSTLTSIGDSAFYKCTSLKEVVLPEKLKSVGYDAFAYCNNLTKITVKSEKLEKFERGTFRNAGIKTENGTEVIFTDTVTIVPACMFSRATSFGSDMETYPRVKSVTFGTAVTTIGYDAFFDCYELKTVTIPVDAALSTIGESAFEGCSSLQEIVLPENLEELYADAFDGCTALNKIVVYSKELEMMSDLGAFGDAGKESENGIEVIFESTVAYIPPQMFYVTSYGYTNPYPHITCVTINKNVSGIGYSAFKYCCDLETVTIPEDSALTFIGEGAFRNCTSLNEFVIPQKVTTIYGSAFADCTSLKEIKIPQSVETIKGSVFNGCTNLEKVEFAEGLKEIGSYVFYKCEKLKNIVFPETLESLGKEVFGDCTDIKKIYFSGNAPQFTDDTFDYITAYAYYPRGNDTWTKSVLKNYGGKQITWISYCLHRDTELRDQVDATCILNGYTGDTYCTDCREKISIGEEILPHGHVWVDANCITPKTCSDCGETEGEALGHAWADATCTTPKTCTVCNTTEGEPAAHTEEVIPGKAATCTETGLTEGKKCSVCAAVITEQTEIPVLGHIWADATCTAPKTCSVCKVTEGEPLAHTYEENKCTACGAVDENYAPSDVLYGDANGDGAVNAKDAMLVLQFYTKKITEDKLNLAACDVDGNGTVNAKDAMLILQKYTKKIEGFPIETK